MYLQALADSFALCFKARMEKNENKGGGGDAGDCDHVFIYLHSF